MSPRGPPLPSLEWTGRARSSRPLVDSSVGGPSVVSPSVDPSTAATALGHLSEASAALAADLRRQSGVPFGASASNLASRRESRDVAVDVFLDGVEESRDGVAEE